MTLLLEGVFWGAIGATAYSYLGYPLLLAVWVYIRGVCPPLLFETEADMPTVTLIIPVHNEATNIDLKIANTRQLQYPDSRLEVIFVSDGSTDGTVASIRREQDDRTVLLELPTRAGKAAALNAALTEASGEVVVFSDASILLQEDALLEITKPFRDPTVGCVSGEDRIAHMGGEGLYGRYELMLRRLESRLYSIVGASGSFYAQRRSLCSSFTPGLAPDFVSVLLTVRQGLRAISWPLAVGAMQPVTSVGDEWQRKVRTLLRGMSTLLQHRDLLNPLSQGAFAVELLSHKLARWLVPFFLLTALATSGFLAVGSGFFLTLFFVQVALYLLPLLSLSGWRPVSESRFVKGCQYFVIVNAAIVAAWYRYLRGVRQEVWVPSRR